MLSISYYRNFLLTALNDLQSYVNFEAHDKEPQRDTNAVNEEQATLIYARLVETAQPNVAVWRDLSRIMSA